MKFSTLPELFWQLRIKLSRILLYILSKLKFIKAWMSAFKVILIYILYIKTSFYFLFNTHYIFINIYIYKLLTFPRFVNKYYYHLKKLFSNINCSVIRAVNIFYFYFRLESKFKTFCFVLKLMRILLMKV